MQAQFKQTLAAGTPGQEKILSPRFGGRIQSSNKLPSNKDIHTETSPLLKD